MNKSDRLIVALLFCALIGWSIYGRKFMPQPQPVPAAEQTEIAAVGTNSADVVDSTAAPAEIKAASTNAVASTAAAIDDSTPEVEPIHQKPQKTLMLANDVLSLEFSSWGGGIITAELVEIDKDKLKYPEFNEDDSGPVSLDFSRHPALAYNGIPGLSSLNDFELTALPSQNGVEMKAETGAGLSLSRTAMLTNGYILAVTDRITNSSDEAVKIPASQMNLGPMTKIITKAKTRGISYLGIESRDLAEGKVTRWDKKFPKLFGQSSGCSRPDLTGVPLRQELKPGQPLEWAAVKNKFFVQVLIPEDGGVNGTFFAERKDTDARVVIEKVSAAIDFDEKELAPGESYVRTSRYYVGPKKYSEMRALGGNQDRIILRSWPWFGWWRMACAGLLWLMNSLNAVTHNYGIAIILLTIIVKVVFWPVTHKGTESMKRMKEIQPELTKLREKYKDNPKKMQEKQMLLYRENGVNPVAGCLPMLIQMPVFIALFTVLRSAVELRFQSFLWIADLCEPEGLLAGVLPFPAGGLNILPLVMTGTMVLQQKLTPAAGDPQQQKMMQFMPLMMLFIFYNMASALVLYWSVSQGLSILQLYLQQRKEKQKA